MRWRAPDGEVIPAATFVDFAARQGLMPAYGAWIINQTCAQIRRWDDLLGHNAPRRVFVNLGARELNDPALPLTLGAALRRHGIDERRLGIEIVEESFLHESVVHRVDALRRSGHPIALDDFGTGHSTLARLTQLKVDVIKLDKSLTSLLGRNPQRNDFVRAVVHLARTFDASVTAEGVQALGQCEALAAAGVDSLQGFLFGRPAPADDVLEQLQHPGRSLLVRHLLTGDAALVSLEGLASTVRDWYPRPTADILDAIENLVADLSAGEPTRRIQNYLGLTVDRVQITAGPDKP